MIGIFLINNNYIKRRSNVVKKSWNFDKNVEENGVCEFFVKIVRD